MIVARIHTKPAQKANSKQIVNMGGRPRLVPTKADQRAEAELVKALKEHAPEAPYHGPLSLAVTVFHPIPKSWPAWRQRAALAGAVRPASRGTHDLDNVLKLVGDAMTKAGWCEDDTQIVEIKASAVYTGDPGYRLVLVTMADRYDPKATRAEVGESWPPRRMHYFSPLAARGA